MPDYDYLQDTDFLLQNLMDNIPDMIYFKDLESRFIMMNKAAAVWQGFNHPDEAIGTSDFDRYKEEDARRMLADEQRIIDTGEPLEGIEEEETRKNGEVAWVSTTKMPLRGPKGKIVGTFGISRDITDHKEAELRAAYYDAQIRDIKNRMEEDVRMAGELQKTFFPRSYPCFPAAGATDGAVKFLHHYHASGIVSGDFCSVLRLSDTEAGIFLCDVMGHGVRAAIGTALICAMVEEVSALEKDPGKFLDRMNELLLPILRQEDMFLYATACYMVFDASSGMLRFAGAGHPLPLHFSRSGGSADWLVDDVSLLGPALAITDEGGYQTIEKQIQQGETVVMYTDGLYELDSPDGEEFGESRLLAAANRFAGQPLEELFPSLVGAASEFAGGGGFSDDVCLVGFTFLNPMRGEMP
ncbi:MAG: SpoIIE family protein phosphatase [Verrucomicrobiota bacterium]